MERENPDGTKTTVVTIEEANRRSEEAIRKAYSETESWKVAQLAATLSSGRWHMERGSYAPQVVESARALLAEARRQVAAEGGE